MGRLLLLVCDVCRNDVGQNFVGNTLRMGLTLGINREVHIGECVELSCLTRENMKWKLGCFQRMKVMT